MSRSSCCSKPDGGREGKEGKAGRGADQVVWVHVAVHAHVGTARSQVAHHSAGAWPEVLERVLCIDSALNGVSLQDQSL